MSAATYKVLPVVPSELPLPDGLFPNGYEPYEFGTPEEAEQFAHEAVTYPGVSYAELWVGNDISSATYIESED